MEFGLLARLRGGVLMPAGRPRTPTKVLQLRGTHRKDRHGDPESEVQFELLTELPPVPRFLDGIGRFEWYRLGPELIAKQLLTTVDLAAFTLYCVSVSRVVACERVLQEHGMTMFAMQGWIPRPEVAIGRQAGAEVRKFCTEFGLTPSARTRIRVPEKPTKPADDPWGETAANG